MKKSEIEELIKEINKRNVTYMPLINKKEDNESSVNKKAVEKK